METQKTPDVCALPIIKGPCRALKFKFAYNKDTNRCEKFAYGGLFGATKKVLTKKVLRNKALNI